MLPEQGWGAAGKRGGGAGGQSRRARQPESEMDPGPRGRGSPRLGLWALPRERRWPVAERGLFAS